MAQVLLSALTLAILVFALVDIITSDNWRVRHLPKVAWALLVIFLPIIGSLLWFFLGKERTVPAALSGFGSSDSGARDVVRRESTIEEDLAAVEREIEFHEKQAEIRRLEAKLRTKFDQDE